MFEYRYLCSEEIPCGNSSGANYPTAGVTVVLKRLSYYDALHIPLLQVLQAEAAHEKRKLRLSSSCHGDAS